MPPVETSAHTRRAYAADWRDYLGWRLRHGLEAQPLADCGAVGLYLAALAGGERRRSLATIERRLCALASGFAARGLAFDRRDPAVAAALAHARGAADRPPARKQPLRPEHLRAMLDALPPSSLRNLRDRAILLIGFAAGLRRSEIVGLDCGPEDSLQSAGWPELQEEGLLITLRGRGGWREIGIARGAGEAPCPVAALESWMRYARLSRGPLFRRVTAGRAGPLRLNDRHVARLVKRAALAAGLRGDLSEAERGALFAARSLRGDG